MCVQLRNAVRGLQFSMRLHLRSPYFVRASSEFAIREQQRLWRDYTDVQARLSLS